MMTSVLRGQRGKLRVKHWLLLVPDNMRLRWEAMPHR